MRLLLESTLVLDGQFGSHLVGWGWAEDVLLSWIGMVFKVPIQIRSPRNILLTLMWRSREKLCACAARAPHSILGTTHEPPRDPAGLQQLRRGKTVLFTRGCLANEAALSRCKQVCPSSAT